MTVRRANLGDMKEVLDYMTDYHKTSNMSDIKFERTSALKIVEYYIMAKDTCPLIAHDDEGKVIGLLFGGLEPYFFNKKACYATDIFFFSRGEGPTLWKRFRDWAFNSGADRIIMGVSSGDNRAGQLLEALGMNSTGGMYVLRQESS